MTYGTPKAIMSPISGQTCRPRIKKYIREGREIVEAEYYDPASGHFIRKHRISDEPVVKPAEEVKK